MIFLVFSLEKNQIHFPKIDSDYQEILYHTFLVSALFLIIQYYKLLPRPKYILIATTKPNKTEIAYSKVLSVFY